MGKITVKHYLNTNLKPYMIRGEAYYTVYMLITVNRKSTKVPSMEFAEYQTEADFEEILKSDELLSEVKTVENIITAQLAICEDEFDTQLFSAFYNLLPNYYLGDVRCLDDLSDLNTYEGKYSQSGYTLYDWFRPDVQKIISGRLNGKGENDYIKDRMNRIQKDMPSLNEAVLIGFFEVLDVITRSSKKYEVLQRRYERYYSDQSIVEFYILAKHQKNN